MSDKDATWGTPANPYPKGFIVGTLPSKSWVFPTGSLGVPATVPDPVADLPPCEVGDKFLVTVPEGRATGHRHSILTSDIYTVTSVHPDSHWRGRPEVTGTIERLPTNELGDPLTYSLGWPGLDGSWLSPLPTAPTAVVCSCELHALCRVGCQCGAVVRYVPTWERWRSGD